MNGSRMQFIATAVAFAVLGASASYVVASVEESVPIAGDLTASDLTPAVGEIVDVTLDVTAQEDVPALQLELRLGPGLEPLNTAALRQDAAPLASGATRTLVVRTRVTAAGEQTIQAFATLDDSKDLVRRRMFVVVLNEAPKPVPNASAGTGADGERLIVFPSGRRKQ
jgi:hypothetical protein